MRTIEMIGPPGAGKSTIVTTLSKTREIHADRLNMYTRSLPFGSLIQHIPANKSVARRVFSHVRPAYEYEFITQFPGLLETTATIIRNYEDKNNVLNSIFLEAAWYEFFSVHLQPHETYLIDDGLYQFHLRLLSINGWNAEKIMNLLPEPDKFIFVKAPPEICLERQDDRLRGRASILSGLSDSDAIKNIERMQSGSEEFISEAQRRGIDTEIIDNW